MAGEKRLREFESGGHQVFASQAAGKVSEEIETSSIYHRQILISHDIIIRKSAPIVKWI